MKTTLLGIICFLSFTVFSQFSNEDQLKARFDVILSEKMVDMPVDTELSLAMVSPTEMFFLGMTQTEDGFKRIQNQDTLYEIGQMTSVFTAAVLSHYVNAGEVNLNDIVKERVSIELKPKFTFLQLANHHSGLDRTPLNQMTLKWNSQNPWENYTEQLLREYLDSRLKLVAKPGTKYFESNTGTALLAFCLKRIEATPYEELVQKYVLDVYGMPNSTFDLKKAEPKHVEPYSGLGKVGEYWTFKPTIGAIGGLRSSATDMAAFMQAHFNSANKDLLLSTEKTGTIDATRDIGLGWEIHKDIVSHEVLCINGRTHGFSCCMIIDMQKKRGFALLSNQVLADTDKALEEVVKSQIK